MDQCRQKSWIAGAIAGTLTMLAVWLSGGHSLAVALLLGSMAGGLLGAFLVWGVCSGRGTAIENEAVIATMWEPEPFTPSRRIVASGGRVVSTRPLGAATPDGLDETPMPGQVTLQASRDPALARPSSAAANGLVPETMPMPMPVPDANHLPGSATFTDPLPATEAEDARAAQAAHKLQEARHKADRAVQTGGPAAQDVAMGEDRVATLTIADGASGADDRDELTRIDGIDQMTATWLHDSGVTHLAQIAAWDDADIARFAGMMGREGHRIRHQDWAGQAVRLTGSHLCGPRDDG